MIYYHGASKNRIGSDAFEQLENDSDRAVGIVGGAIVEQRLQEAIKARLKKDQAVHERMFRFSGPLGTFSVKIDMAYLLGVIGPEGRADLIIIKGIRNDFAHALELDGFQADSIRDRCRNLILIDKLLGELSEEDANAIREGRQVPRRPEDPPTRFTGAVEQLKIPRRRYILACQYYSDYLGSGTDSGWPLPLL